MTRHRPTVISFLLDETGSMNSIKDDTIGGFNAYLDGLSGNIEFTLVKFDSMKIEKVCVGLPVEEVERLNEFNYHPGAATPLIDAAYKTIAATRDLVGKRHDNPVVIVVIQTDGIENSSTEYTNGDLAALIKELTMAGWQFVFLGADIDAYAQAGKWGISRGSTVSYTKGRTYETMRNLRGSTMSVVNSGGAVGMSFSARQKAEMGDFTPLGEDTDTGTDKPATKIVDDLSLTD